jgi:hypothetical protein
MAKLNKYSNELKTKFGEPENQSQDRVEEIKNSQKAE